VLEKNPPKNLVRVFPSRNNRERYKDELTKVVYAIGFQRRPISIVNAEVTFFWKS